LAAAAPDLLMYGTVVGIGDTGVLIRGPSGSGKSDLALRLLSLNIPGLASLPYLVADDQVEIRRDGAALLASPPSPIAGLLEVRGLGILRVAHRAPAAIDLIADIVPRWAVDRLPDPWPTAVIAGLSRPVMKVCALEASAPHKLLIALHQRPWISQG
jgi:HPr kinase/phosphorylase